MVANKLEIKTFEENIGMWQEEMKEELQEDFVSMKGAIDEKLTFMVGRIDGVVEKFSKIEEKIRKFIKLTPWKNNLE